MVINMTWKYIIPDEFEEAKEIPYKIFDAEHAAQLVSELDYDMYDGFERGENEFDFTVISPEGKEYKYVGRHEIAVEHYAYPVRNKD